jgi:uncharacterized protein YrrD
MLRSTKELMGYKILATNEDIGKINDFLFDDEHWVLRYLVVDTGTLLSGRKVLISPVGLGDADWKSRCLSVKLTKEQVEKSPPIDTDKPVSRQKEAELRSYYGWAAYGGGGTLPPVITTEAAEEDCEEGDTHLRSTREVCGYRIQAIDGKIGHAEDFIMDDESWTLSCMVVDTRNWLPGKKVMVPLQSIKKVSWDEKSVHIDLPRKKIKKGPAYNPSAPVNREYALHVYDYHGRPR